MLNFVSFANSQTVELDPFASDLFSVFLDSSDDDSRITLPEAPVSIGKICIIKRIDATGHSVTISANVNGPNHEKINGNDTLVLGGTAVVRLQCDGLGWHTI